MNNTKEYFADTTAISNSQLRNFISYNKYGQKLYTPDKYLAYHITKTMKFKVNDAIIIGKIVDIYFDGTGSKVWEKYIPVARRTGKNPEGTTEITKIMESTALEMIEWGKNFKQFTDFLKLKGTEAQVQLKKEIEIDGRKITIKGLLDYINKDLKLIVDLKTTGSMDMILDSLQFKGEPKLTANYIRQLAIYNKLSGGDYDGALALVTNNGVKWIAIPNEYLVSAWEILEKDIVDLDNFLEDPTTLNESIFTYDESLDDLTL